MHLKFWKRQKPPRVHRVIGVWEENGVDCWLMPFQDFNHLYAGENVVNVKGKVCASLTFASTPIIVYRQEK